MYTCISFFNNQPYHSGFYIKKLLTKLHHIIKQFNIIIDKNQI